MLEHYSHIRINATNAPLDESAEDVADPDHSRS
jgi:hypothetical protein